MIIEVKNELIYINEDIFLTTFESDSIAQANGFIYAERFVKHYAGQKLELDRTGKIITNSVKYFTEKE